MLGGDNHGRFDPAFFRPAVHSIGEDVRRVLASSQSNMPLHQWPQRQPDHALTVCRARCKRPIDVQVAAVITNLSNTFFVYQPTSSI